MTPIPVAAQSIESSPASIAAACLIEFLETVGKGHQYDVREHVKLVQLLASLQPTAPGADSSTLSDPRLRAIAICDGGGYQDDVTAEWTFSDAAFLKTMRAVITASQGQAETRRTIAPVPLEPAAPVAAAPIDPGAALRLALEVEPVAAGTEFPEGRYAGVCPAAPNTEGPAHHLMHLRGEWLCRTWDEAQARVGDMPGSVPTVQELEFLRTCVDVPVLYYGELYWASDAAAGGPGRALVTDTDNPLCVLAPVVTQEHSEYAFVTRVLRIPVGAVVTCTEPKYGPGEPGYRPACCDRGVKDSVCCSEGCAADADLRGIAKRNAAGCAR